MRYPGRQYRFGRLMAAALILLDISAAAAEPAGVYLYQGADRGQRLIEKARQEGTVLLYTSMQLGDSGALAQAFEQKYGIKVAIWRASSEKLVHRALTEAQAGRHDADAFETDGAEMEILYREKQLAQFYTPSFKDIPPEIMPAHKRYAPTRLTLHVLAYNTKLVPPHAVPDSYKALLDPKWEGRIGVEAADVAWFAAVTKAMGEKEGLSYFQNLAAAKPSVRAGHTLVAELVAAGDITLAVNAYVHSVARLKKKGAPIEWKPLPPVFGRAAAIGLAARAAHPHAALLFADFMLSKEGQEIIKARNRVPSSRAVHSPLNELEYGLIDPVIILDEWERWESHWSALFLKGRKVQKDAD